MKIHVRILCGPRIVVGDTADFKQVDLIKNSSWINEQSTSYRHLKDGFLEVHESYDIVIPEKFNLTITGLDFLLRYICGFNILSHRVSSFVELIENGQIAALVEVAIHLNIISFLCQLLLESLTNCHYITPTDDKMFCAIVIVVELVQLHRSKFDSCGMTMCTDLIYQRWDAGFREAHSIYLDGYSHKTDVCILISNLLRILLTEESRSTKKLIWEYGLSNIYAVLCHDQFHNPVYWRKWLVPLGRCDTYHLRLRRGDFPDYVPILFELCHFVYRPFGIISSLGAQNAVTWYDEENNCTRKGVMISRMEEDDDNVFFIWNQPDPTNIVVQKGAVDYSTKTLYMVNPMICNFAPYQDVEFLTAFYDAIHLTYTPPQ